MADRSYLDLADELTRSLHDVDAGTRVISEHALARSTGISRPTARAVLQELERRYLVRRVRGAGTFVNRRIDYVIGPHTPPSWSESVRAAGATPLSRIERVRRGTASNEVRDRLELRAGASAVMLMRVNSVDGLPAGLGTSHLPDELLPGLTEHLGPGTSGGSIYRTLVDHYGLEPVRTWTTASLEIPPPDSAARMGLEAPEPTWYVESINRDRASGRPVELARGWMRADVYRIILQAGARSPRAGTAR
ncbi:MAG: GntR family transcriptional regulator [Acidimicrobiales bacterium]